MNMFEMAIKKCDDCDKSGLPLAWSKDGNTKICSLCKQARGDRELGQPSSRAIESEKMEKRLLRAKRR